MKFNKKPLSFAEQADLLLSRGMSGDRSLMIERLSNVNYYRLSGYWYPFQNVQTNQFHSGTTFENIWLRYVFDRQLRLLLMDAIERIEVTVRTQLSYHHVHQYGAFGYAKHPDSLPKKNSKEYQKFIENIEEETKRSREQFVEIFLKKYGYENKFLPLWMASEIMSFGTLLTFFRGASHQVKRAVSSQFGMPATVFESWLLALNTIRNICAHHSRLWNREIGVKPLIPRPAEYPDWYSPVAIPNNRFFGILMICRYCLSKIAPQSSWPDRFEKLLSEYPQIPLKAMGISDGWKESPIWKGNKS